MVEVIVNGETRVLANAITIAALLDEMEISLRWAIVERNGEPLARALYGDTMIAPGDRIEIATPMAGG